MRLPTREELRYHGSRWAWVVGLATLAYVVFPSSATNVELLAVGTPAERDVIAPFTFPVNKSDQERVREAEELAGSVKPIYQYQERALDSAKIAMHGFFSSAETAADQGGATAILQVVKAQGFALGAPEAAYLAKGGKRHALEKALSEVLDRTLALGITGPGVLQVEQAPELIVRRRGGDQPLTRRRVGPDPARLAHLRDFLGAAGVLPPRNVSRAATGGADRRAVRAGLARSGGRGALRPEPSGNHLPALHGDVAHRLVQRAGLDDRRDDSGDRDRLAAGVPRHSRAVSVRHRRRDGRADGARAAAPEQFLRARVDHRPGVPRGRRRAGARRQLDGRGHRPAGRVGRGKRPGVRRTDILPVAGTGIA